MSASAYPTVTVTMLRSSWWQLIDDYENYCGMGAWDTEVFESVRVAGDEHAPDGNRVGPGEVSEFSERLDAIEARANAATAGPWHAFDPFIGYECGECTCGQGPNAPYGHEGQCGLDMLGSFDGLAVDREFIAAARTEVPWLVSELRKAHVVFERLRELHDTWNADIPDVVAECGECKDDWPCRTLRQIDGGVSS